MILSTLNYSRLVSGFEQKVVRTNYHGLHRQMRGSFPKFVDLILQQAQECNCLTNRFERDLFFNCRGHHRFEQFCRTQCECMNEHWSPLVSRCAYCAVDYDFVGRMEDFNQHK